MKESPVTEGKHTPGPWRVREMLRYGEVHGYFVAAPDVNGFAYDAEILGEDEYRGDMERWAADARLAAAAPELLAALKSMFDSAVIIGSPVGDMNAAEAAIAKATGAS